MTAELTAVAAEAAVELTAGSNDSDDVRCFEVAENVQYDREGTVIVQGMNPAKITNGINGYLRQEFRELEILNEITRQRFEGQLPEEVSGINRRELIVNYRSWAGHANEPAGMHPALQWVGKEPQFPMRPVTMGKWDLVGGDKPKDKLKKSKDSPMSISTDGKRKAEGQNEQNIAKRRKISASPAPRGMLWDAEDYSCAYDALFTCLRNIWIDHDSRWSIRFASVGQWMGILAQGFVKTSKKTGTLENARDVVRHKITAQYPAQFPTGSEFTYLDNLTQVMFKERYWGTRTTKCAKCQRVQQCEPDYLCTKDVYKKEHLRTRYKSEYSLSHWLMSEKIGPGNTVCEGCGSNTVTFIVPTVAPPILYFGIDDTNIRIDHTLRLLVGDEPVTYMLRGVLYAGGNHFTSRIVTESGDIWYHDGIETGSKLITEGNLHTKTAKFLNTCIQNDYCRLVAGAIYARAD
ncbi:hypothetical protein R3P38DRAFT_3320577 [Favolaschia claudopus]|uniref:Uncharacterized protein n=1 Tax=Favolaschia claudopus TaxID=2862362 RepID=A0AAW0AWT3_9AGAR